MNLISKCNCCIKEDVCKFKEQYIKDTKNILNSIENKELTEVSIKCKKFNTVSNIKTMWEDKHANITN